MDSEEDEVFFGQQSSKEEQGLKSKNLKLLRRTLQGVIRPQNSPKNVPFNPIQEEDIENNIDVEKGAFLTPLMLKMLNQNNFLVISLSIKVVLLLQKMLVLHHRRQICPRKERRLRLRTFSVTTKRWLPPLAPSLHHLQERSIWEIQTRVKKCLYLQLLKPGRI